MQQLVRTVFSILGTDSMRGQEGRRILFYLGCLLQHGQEDPRYKFVISDYTLSDGGAAVYSPTFHDDLSEGAAEVLSGQQGTITADVELVERLKNLAGDLTLHDYLEILAWFQMVRYVVQADEALTVARLGRFGRLNDSYKVLVRTRKEDAHPLISIDDELREVLELLPITTTI